MRLITLLVLSLLMLAAGVLLVIVGEFVVGASTGLLGLGGILGYVVERGKRRGDPRAGGLHEPHTRGPYLLLATAIGGIFAAIGVIYILFTPVNEYRGWVRTPAEARVMGAIALAFGLVFIVAGITRWVRSQRSR